MASGNPTDPPDIEFLRLPAVIARVGLSKTEIYRRIKEGTFPASRPYRGGARMGVFWLSSEIRQWQHNELAAAARDR
jgi:prophage regulatory protein